MLPKLSDATDEEEKLPSASNSQLFSSIKLKRTEYFEKSKIQKKAFSLSFKPIKPKIVQKYNISEDYKIGERLGIGCYSQVYFATNVRTNLKVAVKKSKGFSNVDRLRKEYEL